MSRTKSVNRKIGLTGAIASGKSSVAEMLSRLLQCEHVDADDICRQLLEPHAEGWQEFTGIFGGEYLTEAGTINRSGLRNDLFADAKFRRQVNDVIHPLVKQAILSKLDRAVASDPRWKILVEVPLLFEVKWEDLFDTVIVVYADHETCLSRLMKRDGINRGAAEQAMQMQWPLAEKVLKADHVIDNSGSLQETRSQVEHLADLLQNNGPGAEKKLDSKK